MIISSIRDKEARERAARNKESLELRAKIEEVLKQVRELVELKNSGQWPFPSFKPATVSNNIDTIQPEQSKPNNLTEKSREHVPKTSNINTDSVSDSGSIQGPYQ